MIVLTGGKDASSAYCLTTALYCPLPGQYSAIARHKTIRRERKKSPLSYLLFTWIFYSSDYAELTEHSCSTDYARILNGSSTCSAFEEGRISV